jgi:hypothetical protein
MRFTAAESRVDISYMFIRRGEADIRPASSYVFTVAELLRMHATVGLKVVELLSSAAGNPYQNGVAAVDFGFG